jgi:hypothetical protein
MSEVSRTWVLLYEAIRTSQISHAPRGESIRSYRRLPPSFQNITNNSCMVGVIPSYGGAGVGAPVAGKANPQHPELYR